MAVDSSEESRSGEVDETPPDPNRRNQHSRAAILNATVDQLDNVGYARMTIERVAAQAGVGKATVYRWWPSKARLVVEALNERYPIEPVEPTGNLRDDTRALMWRAIELVSKSPFGHTLPQLVADIRDDPESREQLVKWMGPAKASHLALLYGAAGRGELPHDVDAKLILDLIVAVVLWRNMLNGHIDNRLVEQVTDLLVDGHLPRDGPTEIDRG